MASAKDYLEKWRKLYSFPNYITGNSYLTEDGYISLDNPTDWNYSQRVALLKGNAIGTYDNNYLDPTPNFNSLGEIYTNIINAGFKSARTDSIKMNLLNMDFTNGRANGAVSVEPYEFFNFYGYETEDELSKNFFSEDNKKALTYIFLKENKDFSLIKTDDNDYPWVYEVDETTLNEDIRVKKDIDGNEIKITLLNDLERYTEWYYIYKDPFFDFIERDKRKDEWNSFWNKVIYNKEVISGYEKIIQTVTYYYPDLSYLISFMKYENSISGEANGLNLLMPQYHRRVEVEDLDKNFWVISQVLDAVINALWGPYGLIDVVRQLILKVNQIEEFVGLDGITDIELCYKGNNELYFDMYSRFLLSNLELKLKTNGGERNIKNIFKAHTERSDRNSTTDGYETTEELFLGIQTNEITPMSKNFEFTGLYDSDIISSSKKVTIDIQNNQNITKFVSLSSVIDAINNNIVGNKVENGYYDYDIGPAHKKFFALLDISPDGTFSPKDLKDLAQDELDTYVGQTLSSSQIERFKKYSQAKEYLLSFTTGEKDENSDEFKDAEILFNELGINFSSDSINNLFNEKQALIETSLENLDENHDKEISEKEYLNYANKIQDEIKSNLSMILRENVTNFTNISDQVIIDELDKLDIGGKDSSKYSEGLISNIKLLKSESDYLNRYFCTDTDTEHSENEFRIYIPNNTIDKISFNYLGFEIKPVTFDDVTQDRLILSPTIMYDINKNSVESIITQTSVLKDQFFQHIDDIVGYCNTTIENSVIKAGIQNLGEDVKTVATFYILDYYYKGSYSINSQQQLKNTILKIFDLTTEESAYYNFIKKVSNNLVMYGMDILAKEPGKGYVKRSTSQILNVLVGCDNFNKSEKDKLEKTIEEYSINIGQFTKVINLPFEDIYVYNINAAKIISKYILYKNNQNSHTNIGNIMKNSEYSSDFFNIINNSDIDLYDAIKIMTILKNNEDYSYYALMRSLRNRIDTEKDVRIFLKKLINASILEGEHHDTQKINWPINNDAEEARLIKDFLFVKKFPGDKTFKTISSITTPTIDMLIKIAKLMTPSRMVNGYEITEAMKPYLLESTKSVEYGLYGNILIFLFDDDYYELKFDQDGSDGEIQGDDGLYVKVTDGYYTTSNPVIRYDTFYSSKTKNTNKTTSGLNTKYIYKGATDYTYALFIPRKDLVGGEIIQLRLTEKGQTKKMLDLSKLDEEKGFSKWIEYENVDGKSIPRSNLFLSLHNCFADNISQYNHQTTLFFKDTTPEVKISTNTTGGTITGYNTKAFKNVNDWFCNGIECEYFKPANLKVSENTVLSESTLLHKNLPIKASMICKNEPFVDNSFIFEEGPIDDPKTEEVFYTFARKQAYGAAQRHNLLYYSSPATQEGDMFIHAPSQMLVSPSLRGDESIQAPYWTGATTDIKYAYDVLRKAGDSCKLADIKNMLYKNSLAKEKRPLVIEAVWGRRDVDNYIKKKKIKYIVVEREPGSRNQTYGPNCIGFSASSGYLHSKDGIKSLIEKEHWLNECRVKWYNDEGVFIPYPKTKPKDNIPNDKYNLYFPPASAKYGVIDLTKVNYEFASAFIVRFYSSNLYYAEKNGNGSDNTNKNIVSEFTFNGGKNARKPIFKMVYFFGENDLGISTTKQNFVK